MKLAARLGMVCTYVLLGMSLLTPAHSIHAQTGLVPAGQTGNYNVEGYGSCEFVETINNVIKFTLSLVSVIVVFAVVYQGFVLVTSVGDTAALTSTKNLVSSVLIGWAILLASFLIVNTILGIMLGGDESLIRWDRVECSYSYEVGEATYDIAVTSNNTYDPLSQPTLVIPGYNDSIIPNYTSGDNNGSFGDGVRVGGDGGSCQASGVQTGSACYATGRCGFNVSSGTCGRAKTYDSLINQAAAKYDVPANRIRAIMIVESSANPNARSPVGARGLMQLMPGTAASACGLTGSAINDPARNIDCGARYYATQYHRFGSHNLAAAAYNAGPGRNQASRDCPGLLVWQCPFNSGGCCEGNQVTATNCRINTGFDETRAYVDKVNAATQCQ